MKKSFYLIALCTCQFAQGQIICIKCYNQNDSIALGINNLLLNGGFENTNCVVFNFQGGIFCPNSSFYNCDIADWTCTGGGPLSYPRVVDSISTVVVEGTKAVYF